MIPFIIRDSLLCLVFLIGAGTGIFAMTRGRAKVGGFALAGFLLLGVDPVAEFIIFNFLAPNSDSYELFNWAYACISGIAGVTGVLLILTALYFAIQPQQEEIIYTQPDQ